VSAKRSPKRLAEERQSRLDQKRREALPLFATAPEVLEELAPLPTVDEILREKQHTEQWVRARHLRMLQTSLAGWAKWRGVCERYLTREQIAHCEGFCRKTYPSYQWSPEYRHDYWHRLARDLGLDPSWPEPTWCAWPGKH
jgi:hypothetical protein